MGAVLAIVLKDLRQRLRDRSALIIAVVVPLALAFIFAQTLSGVDTDAVTFDYGVVLEDEGPLGRSFATDVLGSLEDGGLATVEALPASEALGAVEDGRIDAAFVVPAGFSAAVMAGETAAIDVIGNVDSAIGTLVAGAVADAFAGQLTAVQASVATTLAAGLAEASEAAAVAARAALEPSALVVEDATASRKELEITTFYSAGLAVFFLFFTVQFGVSSLLDERRDGTLARLLAAPISRQAVLIGKLGASFVLGVISMIVLVVATTLFLGAEWGNPVGVAILVVAGVLAAMGVMALVASFARTSEQAGNTQAIVAIVLGMAGGAFFPVAQAGGLIEAASLLTPHAWFLRGLGELQAGAGPAAVLPAAGAIIAFALVTGGAAMTRLGKLVQP